MAVIFHLKSESIPMNEINVDISIRSSITHLIFNPRHKLIAVDVQPKNQAPAAPVSVDQQRNQRVLESAQAEWENVTTITAGKSSTAM